MRRVLARLRRAVEATDPVEAELTRLAEEIGRLRAELAAVRSATAQATQQATTARATAESTADGLAGVEDRLDALMERLGSLP